MLVAVISLEPHLRSVLPRSALERRAWLGFDALLDRPIPLSRILRDHSAESMREDPNGGLKSQPRQKTLQRSGKATAHLFDRSIGRQV